MPLPRRKSKRDDDSGAPVSADEAFFPDGDEPTSGFATAHRPPAPGNGRPVMSSDSARSVRFQISRPEGYFFPQVEQFVDEVSYSISALEDAVRQRDTHITALTTELEFQTGDAMRLRTEIEIFRQVGNPLVKDNGEYLTESDLSHGDGQATAEMAAELDRARSELTAMTQQAQAADAEVARLRQVEADQNAWTGQLLHDIGQAQEALAARAEELVGVRRALSEVEQTLHAERMQHQQVLGELAFAVRRAESAEGVVRRLQAAPAAPPAEPDDDLDASREDLVGEAVIPPSAPAPAEQPSDVAWDAPYETGGTPEATPTEPVVHHDLTEQPVGTPALDGATGDAATDYAPSGEDQAVTDFPDSSPVGDEQAADQDAPGSWELDGTYEPQSDSPMYKYRDSTPGQPIDTHGVPLPVWAPELDEDRRRRLEAEALAAVEEAPVATGAHAADVLGEHPEQVQVFDRDDAWDAPYEDVADSPIGVTPDTDRHDAESFESGHGEHPHAKRGDAGDDGMPTPTLD